MIFSMMRRRAGALAAVAALLGATAPAWAQAAPTVRVADTPDIALPDGDYAVMASSDDTVLFLALGDVHRTGDIVTFWVMGVNDPPARSPMGGMRAMTVLHYRLDCAARTDTYIWFGEYDETGHLLGGETYDRAPRPNGDGTPMATAASVMCDGAKEGDVVSGWRGALAHAREMIRGGSKT
jgi:hypothetical protein